jgi:HK97 gp10 family phage protein
MSDTIQLRGSEELIRNLRSLDQAIRQEIANSTLTEAASEIADRARSRVPTRTGKLASLIGYHLFQDGDFPAARVGVNAEHRASQKDGFYAIMVERGTKPRFAKNRNKKPMIRPASRGTAPRKPFLGPAFDEVAPKVADVLARKIESHAEAMP